MDGKGEDPAVQAMLSEQFTQASNVEALDIGLQLQQIIRGQNAILSQIQGQGEAISQLKSRMERYDKAAEQWETDRQGFMENVQEKADNLKITDPAKKAALIAREAQRVQDEIQKAIANKAVDDIQFGAWMENQPKVTVTSPGKPVTVNEAGVIQMMMEPEVIKIRNRQWVLPPGIPVDVPQPVADEFYARQKITQETVERKKILNANAPMDNVIMAQKWNEINQKYGAATQAMPSDDR